MTSPRYIAPWRALPQRLLIAFVQAYRYLLSPWLGSSCRFEPTCSTYSLEALRLHGAAAGSYLTLRRIGRCHPWCQGGVDAVPAVAPRLFTSRLTEPAPPIAGPACQPLDAKTP
jgi:putative membrane protein insertion efficiency factor